MDRKKILKNLIFSFGGQILIIVLGLIIPRIMITNYGSDINGLLSTISQIFTCMALLEAGIGQAARNAFYQPFAEKNRDGISYIASIAQRYFRRMTVYYGSAVILASIFFPFIIKTDISYVSVLLIILLEGMSGVLTFYFIQTQTIMLEANGFGYINNNVNVVSKTCAYIVKIVMASLGIDIVILQLGYFIITIIKVIFYRVYFIKHYNWINYKQAPKGEKLKDRNTFIVTEIAWTIFSSTDMIVLSIFVSTQMSSVYGIYNMIFSNLNILLNAIFFSLNYILGQTYYNNIENYKKVHDAFNSIFLGGMTVLMSVAYVLILPFVKLYTAGVEDVEYVYSALPIMFCLVQMLSWSRYVAGNLIGVAGRAQKALWVNVTETFINLALSIVFVSKLGIEGVLLATVLALPLKLIYCNYIADHVILKRSLGRTIGILFGNYALFGVIVFINRFIRLDINDYVSFIKYGFICSIIIGVLGIIVNSLINPDCINYVIKLIRNRRRSV